MEDLTWTCHVCGKTRPDALIGVRKSTVEINGMTITQNVRYCKDSSECYDGAADVDFLGVKKRRAANG